VNRFDLLIKSGVVVDGSGSPPLKADVGVVGDRVEAVGDLRGFEAELVIDAGGRVVAPGFIDIHNHSDDDLLAVPTADNYVFQGVTTLVIGNCGASVAPLTDLNYGEVEGRIKALYPDLEVRWRSFGEYLEALSTARPKVNVVPLVGHGTLRSAVAGFDNVRLSEGQLEEMRRLANEAMEEGAFGFSSGLIYVPGIFSTTEELVALAKAVVKRGGIYSTHIRGEGVNLLDSVSEAIRTGVESGIPVEISHLKASGRASWGRVAVALSMIEDCVSRGLDVSADAYPYTAAATSLSALLPSWVREGGTEKLVERLKEPSVVEALREAVPEEERVIEWSDVLISWSRARREFEGLRMSEVAERMGVDPLGAVARLLVEDEGRTGIVVFAMADEDVERVIRHPFVAIGSDGSVVRYGEGKPHPRYYGAFPRVIARYVRERKLLSLPEAVRKMTSLPARKLRLWDRGLLRPGFRADIVVFNYYTIADTATYQNPHSYPRGIDYVIVNGRVVAERGKLTRERPGEVLRLQRF